MANTLVSAAELADFPGAPFADVIVDDAVAQLQILAGWHIAPVVTETIVLDHDGGRDLLLPSRKVVKVDEIRDMSGSTPAVITGWRLSPAGYVTGCWPRGTAVLEVDLTHGYAQTPAPIRAAVARLAASLKRESGVQSVSIDDYSTQYFGRDPGAGGVVAEVVSAFGLPREFG